MSTRIRIIALFVSTTLLFAGKPPSKTSPDLPKGNPSALTDVIIQFTLPLSNSQLGSLNAVLASGGKFKYQFGRINTVAVKIPQALVPVLAANPFVKYISADRKAHGMLDVTTGTVNAPIAWSSYGLDGTGVGVAVIDSGVTLTPDLKNANNASRIVYSEDVTGGNGADVYGHGTHVAGIVGSNGASSTGPNFTHTFKGVAPNVNIISLRVLDQNGSAQESDVIYAIQRAIDLKSTYNIRVINLSLGRPVFESYQNDPLCQAVEAAWNAGIVVVVAAGNSGRDNTNGTQGYATIASPGNDPYVITVGSMDAEGTTSKADDKVSSYSSKGPTAVDHFVKPDIMAPGNRVTSLMSSPTNTLATTYPTTLLPNSAYQSGTVSGNSTKYFTLSGTSMATPAVSGAAALLIQKDPTLTPDQVKARLMKTATKVFTAYSTSFDQTTGAAYQAQADIFTVGAGYLDIFAALQNTDRVTQPAMSPQASLDPVSGNVVIAMNSSIVWGDAAVWGGSIVWGDSVLTSLADGISIVWGDSISIVWGDSVTSGYSIVWGDSVNAASLPTASSSATGDK